LRIGGHGGSLANRPGPLGDVRAVLTECSRVGRTVARVRTRLVVFVAVLAVSLVAVGCGAAPSGARPQDAATFEVSVVDGYGSGSYAPGTVVHVWADASTSDEVVRPWTGDDELLVAPAEWHTTFVMPARDVALRANVDPVDVTLTVEQYRGSTNRLKTVRYHFPPSMRGVVLMSHGTGGSSRYVEGEEAFPLALALIDAGYGVISTEAEEVVAGDLNGDGKIRWRSGYADTNVDLANLEWLLADLGRRGKIPEGTPRFALGMSAGGSFSHLLGTVSATSAAPAFPHLQFNAVISYCADATGPRSSVLSTTPSAWYLCGADDNGEVSNVEARANERQLRGRSIPTDLFEHTPSPLYPERFTRIPGISAATSRAMVAELEAAGHLDGDGFIVTDGDEIAAEVAAEPATFPTIVAQGAPRTIRSQIKVVRAEHSMYADATARTIGFFDEFVDPPSAPFGSWAALIARITLELTGTGPTATDLAAWQTALGAGTKTSGELVASLRRSADHTANVDPIARLYRAYLGRTPDAGGLQYWIDRRRSGSWTLQRISDHFATSSEFIRTYGTLTNRQFVARIYTDVLGRPADPSGLDYWTDQLNRRRRTRGGVMLGFSESNEYRRKQAEITDGSVVPILLLDRAPSATQLDAWVERQKGGTALAVLIDELLQSDDYAEHLIG
jgi:hypothetical protein